MLPERPMPDQDEIDLQRWTTVLLRGWVVLIVGLLAGAAFGWFAATRAPRVYEATATVLLTPPPDPGGVFTMPGLRGAVISQSIAGSLLKDLRAGGYDGSHQDLLAALSVEPVINTPMFQIKARLDDPARAATAATRASELAIAYMSDQWNELSTRAVQQLAAQRARARLRLTEIEQETASAEGRTARDLDLEREVRRRVYLDMAARHEEAQLESESAAPPLQIVHAAAVPEQALPRSRTRTIALGAFAGLMLAGCLIVLREWRITPAGRPPAAV